MSGTKRYLEQLDHELAGQQQEATDAKGISDEEKIFGENLKALRVRTDESQTGLAKKMAELGFPYHAMTISRIESGRRGVRIGEARALAELVGASLGYMLRQPENARAVDRLDKAMDRATRPLFEIERLARAALQERPYLEYEIYRAQEAGVEPGLIKTAMSWLADTPEDAVRRARRRVEVEEKVEERRDQVWDEVLAAENDSSPPARQKLRALAETHDPAGFDEAPVEVVPPDDAVPVEPSMEERSRGPKKDVTIVGERVSTTVGEFVERIRSLVKENTGKTFRHGSSRYVIPKSVIDDDLLSAFDRLSDRDRDRLILHHVRGLSAEQLTAAGGDIRKKKRALASTTSLYMRMVAKAATTRQDAD